MHAAAASRRVTRPSWPVIGDQQNARAESAAKATPAIDTAFGRTPCAASVRVSLMAHRVFLVASTRRGAFVRAVTLENIGAPLSVFRVNWRIGTRWRSSRAHAEATVADERMDIWPDLRKPGVDLVVTHRHVCAVVV